MANEDMNKSELKNALEQCRTKADDLFLSLVAIRLSEALDILETDPVNLESAPFQIPPKPDKTR